jgi:hypothetical protein
MVVTGKVVELSFAKAGDPPQPVFGELFALAGAAGRGAAGAGRPPGGANPGSELLLNQVKPLLKAFSYVETRATLRNERTRLDLVVTAFSPPRLFAILRQFQQRYPQTQVHLTEVLENAAPCGHYRRSRCDGADPPPG